MPTVWPCLNYRDARARSPSSTEAFGFVETLVVPGETDDVVVHAELRWPEGGGVMLGTAGRDDSEFSRLPTSCASVYVVTDDPHGVYARAIGRRADDRARDARRGLRLDRLQRARPRGQHLELRHLPRRGLTGAAIRVLPRRGSATACVAGRSTAQLPGRCGCGSRSVAVEVGRGGRCR